jgi:hypothetical protein
MGAEAGAIVKQLEIESDLTILRALVLSLRHVINRQFCRLFLPVVWRPGRVQG